VGGLAPRQVPPMDAHIVPMDMAFQAMDVHIVTMAPRQLTAFGIEDYPVCIF